MAKEKKVLTPDDILKYEIARELGLDDKIRNGGWKSLSSKESGRIGGLMANRKKQMNKKTRSHPGTTPPKTYFSLLKL